MSKRECSPTLSTCPVCKAEGHLFDCPDRIKNLEGALREVGGLLSAHEWVIRADAGNTNYEIMVHKVKSALGETV